MRTVYKIVRGVQPRSAIASGNCTVYYRPGVWTRAPKWLADQGYHLLVFTTESLAYSFINTELRISQAVFQVWEASAKGIIEDLPKFCSLIPLEQGIIVLWTAPWPNGTIMAKQIRLERLLWPSE